MMLATALLALQLAQPYPPYPPPPPRYTPPPPPRYYPAAPPQAYEPRGMVGLVFMPLGSSSLSSDVQGYQTYTNAQGALALEIRGQRGGGRLRLGMEFSRHDRILDVSLKYNFLDRMPLQPFVTLGLGTANLGPETAWRGTFSASVGLDFYLTRDFFFTAELKGRAFSDLSPNDAANFYGPGVSMATALFGAGVYF
jgi:hypothetical protein